MANKRKVITLHVAIADVIDNEGEIGDSSVTIQIEGKLKPATKKAIQYAIRNHLVEVRESPRVVA